MHVVLAMGRSLSFFNDVTFKMAAWQPYCIFRFPDPNISLALHSKSKLHWHITCVYGKRPILIFSNVTFKIAAWQPYWIFRYGFRSVTRVYFGISIVNFISMLFVAMGHNLLIFRDVTFKMAAWSPYWIFQFTDSNFNLALYIKFQ